jgi:hypothetical protein
MRNKTIYSTQYVDCEYDVDFNDIMELIESCDENELREIREFVGSSEGIKTNNLMEEQKLALLKVAFEKYNLDQLQERLDIKPYEY